MTSEKEFMNDAAVEVSSYPDTLIWRENTGMAWQGDPVRAAVGQYVRVEPGMKILRKARPIRFGLPGIGDLVGIVTRKPTVIETKTLTGPQREKQGIFAEMWQKAGGVYILARTMKDIRSRFDVI